MSSNDDNNLTQNWVNYLELTGFDQTIPNIQTHVFTVKMGDRLYPVTENKTEYQNSYVCSAYTAYISYAKDELGLLNNALLETLLKPVIFLSSVLLKQAKINQTVSLNNWLISTNVPADWSETDLTAIQSQLMATYPQHRLSIRSLNTITHAPLMQRLESLGWILVPARQVYIFDTLQHWWKKSHTKRDQAFLRKTPLSLIEPKDHQLTDFDEIEQCYQQLFIDKHSTYNPQFTSAYFHYCHQSGLVEFYSFKDEEDRIIASIGLWTQEDVMTTPIVGYDTCLPKSLGLYRLLMAKLLLETKNRHQMMNLSSGAGHFKHQRGGEAVMEYTAYCQPHLPRYQKTLFAIFAKLTQYFAPKIFAEKHL